VFFKSPWPDFVFIFLEELFWSLYTEALKFMPFYFRTLSIASIFLLSFSISSSSGSNFETVNMLASFFDIRGLDLLDYRFLKRSLLGDYSLKSVFYAIDFFELDFSISLMLKLV
jgi:hypothetical protein